MFTTGVANGLTGNELEMWTRAGHIKVKLGKGIDVRKLDSLIAHMVLHAR